MTLDPTRTTHTKRAADERSLPLREQKLLERLERTQAGAALALTLLQDLKDLHTGLHATRLTEWAMRIGEEMGLDDDALFDLEFASMLHDIGKVGVPDAILLKPAALDAEESETVRKHPEYGWAILKVIPGLERASLLVLHHHEWVDGRGYPGGLEGDEIPLGSRILSVIDAFDAMVSDRSYRQGLGLDESMRRLRESAGTQFDADVVEVFEQIIKRDRRSLGELDRDLG